MNILGDTTRVAVSETLPADFRAQLPGDELGHVMTVGARDDTFCLTVSNPENGDLLAYAIVGPDDGGMVTIYAARSWLTGLGAMAIKSLFGASHIMGQPLRVHTERLRTYARMLGADNALEAIDGDGLPMGVFFNGQ